jgi:hypothetical protein
MKTLNYLFCLVFFVSCNQKNSNSLKNENSPIYKKKVLVTDNLLFGSGHLLDLVNLNSETETSNKHQLEVHRFYGSIIYNRTLTKPIIRYIEYIKLEYRKPFIDSLTHNIDSIKCYIGKIGSYNAYYSLINSDSIKFSNDLADKNLICKVAGNLILYNPKNQLAKIITVYYNASEPFYEENRFFYITKQNEIYIIDGIYTDELSGCFFQKEYLIKIGNEGKITVKKLEVKKL